MRGGGFDVYALERGINWFDTSRSYFDSETKLGYALKHRRNENYIITKTQAVSPQQIKEDIYQSLRSLQTEYIDVFMFHKGEVLKYDHFEDEILSIIRQEILRGTIRYWGVSLHDINLAKKAIEYEDISAIMVPINFVSTEYLDEKILNRAADRKIGVFGMKPFGGGRINDIKLCLKFLKRHKNIFPCMGIKNIDELEINTKLWDKLDTSITYAEYATMKRIRQELGNKYCRGCGYCKPCPMSIDIPLITFLKMHIKQMPPKEIFTKEVLTKVRQAETCIRCYQCVQKCPFDLNIPDMLVENCKMYLEKMKEQDNV